MADEDKIRWDESGIIAEGPGGTPRKLRWDRIVKVSNPYTKLVLEDRHGLKATLPWDPWDPENEKAVNAVIENLAFRGLRFVTRTRLSKVRLAALATAALLLFGIAFGFCAAHIAGIPEDAFLVSLAVTAMIMLQWYIPLHNSGFTLGFRIGEDALYLKKPTRETEIPFRDIISICIERTPSRNAWRFSPVIITDDAQRHRAVPVGASPAYTFICYMRAWNKYQARHQK